jgi:hypothetical protein
MQNSKQKKSNDHILNVDKIYNCSLTSTFRKRQNISPKRWCERTILQCQNPESRYLVKIRLKTKNVHNNNNLKIVPSSAILWMKID